jgi:hypothetical protein
MSLSRVRRSAASRAVRDHLRVLCVVTLWLTVAKGVAQGQSSKPEVPSPHRVAVLQLDSDAVHDALAHALTEQLRAVIAARSEFVVRATPVSLEQLSLAQDCESTQPDCLDRIASALSVDSLVFGKLNSESDTAEVARLRRYDVASGTLQGSALATLATQESNDAEVSAKAHELIANLFEFSRAHSPFGRDQLNPKQAALTEATQPTAAERTTNGLTTRKLTGYALLGGAVLSAGLSVLSFVEIDRAQSNDAFDRYRRSVGQLRPSAKDVCDEAAGGQNYGLDSGSFQRVKSSCDTGRTFEVLQFVFIGSAVLSSGLSAYLLLGGPDQNQREHGFLGVRNLSLHPSVQRRGLALGARLRF